MKKWNSMKCSKTITGIVYQCPSDKHPKSRSIKPQYQYIFKQVWNTYALWNLQKTVFNMLPHMKIIWKVSTFVIRIRYLSSIAWLSWQPASNCHTSALNASGTPLFTKVDSPFGRTPRLLCLKKEENKAFTLPLPLLNSLLLYKRFY